MELYLVKKESPQIRFVLHKKLNFDRKVGKKEVILIILLFILFCFRFRRLNFLHFISLLCFLASKKLVSFSSSAYFSSVEPLCIYSTTAVHLYQSTSIKCIHTQTIKHDRQSKDIKIWAIDRVLCTFEDMSPFKYSMPMLSYIQWSSYFFYFPQQSIKCKFCLNFFFLN